LRDAVETGQAQENKQTQWFFINLLN
jgi:hypothetical protein